MKTTPKPPTAPAHVLRPSVMKAPRPFVPLDELKARRHAAAIERAAQGRAAPRQITNGNYTPSGYSGAELKPYAGRPGTAQALTLPSRSGNRLRYPDGRITDLAGNLLDDTWRFA
jgi:hypothetical protein